MGQLRTVACGETNVGRVRDHNEDCFVADADLGLFLVADGVGGGNAGEIAASLLAEYVYDEIAALAEELRGRQASATEQQETYQQRLPRLIADASERIYRKAQEEPDYRGMATTLVLLKLVGDRAIIAHVGDSRLYLLRKEKLHQVTEDHSLAREMVAKGLLAASEIPRFRYKNVILRSVGLQPTVLADVVPLELLPGDVLLLCSDGLSDPVPEDRLQTLLGAGPPQETVPRLVAAALDAGGPDNVTAIAVQVLGTPPPSQVMATEQRASFLSHLFLFEELSFPELLRVMQCVHEQRATKGQRLLELGQEGDQLYLIVSGAVEVSQEGVLLTRIGPGGHFGDLSLVTAGERSADVVAVEDSVLLCIPRREFYELLRTDHTLATKLLWRFLQNMALRVRDLSGQVTRLIRERDGGRKSS